MSGEVEGRRRRAGELGARLAAAAVLAPAALWLIWRGGLPFAAAASAVSARCAFEYYRLAFGKLPPGAWAAVAVAAALPLQPAVAGPGQWGLAMALVLGLSILGWSWEVVRGDPQEGARGASALVSGAVLCGAGLLCLVELRELEGGRQWVAGALVAIWVNDAAAYFGGRFLGRHRLAPRVSPGKTWEGVVAGWLGALVVVEAAALLGLLPLSWPHAGAIAALASVFGPLGDLSKSLLKRARGVKDAGRLIPGHGGMLDRIDSLLFTAPAVLAYVLLFAR